MASFYVRLCATRDKAIVSAPVGKQTITTSASSQTSTVVAPLEATGNMLWRVEADGGAVWVQFGASPTAAAGSDWRVTDGEIAFFTAEPGETVAVINA